jgi:hypothetical protein
LFVHDPKEASVADEMKEPRRYKLPREFTDDDRAATSRFGSGSRGRRPERAEYVRWRERTLRDERDDLELRGRLLVEQAEVLRARAGDQQSDAMEALTVDDHHAHLTATQAAKGKGVDPPQLADGGASKLERQADELESEAEEIHNHLAQENAA